MFNLGWAHTSARFWLNIWATRLILDLGRISGGREGRLSAPDRPSDSRMNFGRALAHFKPSHEQIPFILLWHSAGRRKRSLSLIATPFPAQQGTLAQPQHCPCLPSHLLARPSFSRSLAHRLAQTIRAVWVRIKWQHFQNCPSLRHQFLLFSKAFFQNDVIIERTALPLGFQGILWCFIVKIKGDDAKVTACYRPLDLRLTASVFLWAQIITPANSCSSSQFLSFPPPESKP